MGLEEKLIDNVTEKAGMLLIQIERFSRVLAIVLYQVMLLFLNDYFKLILICVDSAFGMEEFISRRKDFYATLCKF